MHKIVNGILILPKWALYKANTNRSSIVERDIIEEYE